MRSSTYAQIIICSHEQEVTIQVFNSGRKEARKTEIMNE
jgi:hypothetical protein